MTKFIKKAVQILQQIEDNSEKKRWCSQYSVYSKNDNDIWGLKKTLDDLFKKIYKEGLVPPNYCETYETIGDEDLYNRKLLLNEADKMTIEQIIACISMQVRADHFINGILIEKYIAEGILLSYFRVLLVKLETQSAAEVVYGS